MEQLGQWGTSASEFVYDFLRIFAGYGDGGLGYGFFYMLNQNSRLIETEWLYRRERTLYKTDKERQLLLNHERDFFMGTAHEQDSIKDVIRYWERKGDFDKTYLYFNPTEK